MKFWIGTSGWSYSDWAGNFYPPGLKSAGWLEFYSRQFNTVELNMTFYRSPRPEIIHNWVEKTPDDFRFSLKASRQITHLKKLRKVEHDLEHLAFLAKQFRGKIGCLLYQLPPSLTKDIELLTSFLQILPAGFHQVIEFRHQSWYSADVYDLLSRYQVTLCLVSSGRLQSEIVVTSNLAYFRFHGLTGGYRYRYSDDELKKWSEVIARLPVEEACIYFNNDYRAQAVFNAMKLRELLSAVKA
ncbi:MAG: DUF72 domain-containing protein [Acidobacteriota bacterium]|nr:DUF72 domain-containing protein [Acidobacteriota bacterium]